VGGASGGKERKKKGDSAKKRGGAKRVTAVPASKRVPTLGSAGPRCGSKCCFPPPRADGNDNFIDPFWITQAEGSAQGRE